MRWWPCLFAPIVVGAPAMLLLRGHMPMPVAQAVSFTLAWWVVGFLFLKYPPSAQWRFGRWMLGGIAGGSATCVASYVVGSLWH